MTQGSVRIIYHNENAHSIVASAGRMSTTKGRANEIYEKSCLRDAQENIDLIGKIISSGHTSVMEHAFVNLSFDNVSVFVEQFMIEFRLASFTVKSRRYVDFGDMGYAMPDWGQYKENAGRLEGIYRKLMDGLFEDYKYLLEQGIPKEDARFVLPYSLRSNFYCSMNARELVKVIEEMVWGRGSRYPEIVSLGRSLLSQCRDRLLFLKFKEQRRAGAKYNEEEQKAHIPEDGGELVVLLDGTDHPEEAVVRAAMLQEGRRDWQTAGRGDARLQKEMIKNSLLNGRRRELEQVNFTMVFQNLSLSGVTHLVRHRMQSVVIPDYVSVCDFRKYILPKSIVQAGLKERYENVFVKSRQALDELTEAGFARHDRVYVFLSGLTVPVMTTMNANELFTFIRLRTCNRAQWEIRDNAMALLKLLRERNPVLFSHYGPMCCVTGVCPEGKASCGKGEEMRRKFSMEHAEW